MVNLSKEPHEWGLGRLILVAACLAVGVYAMVLGVRWLEKKQAPPPIPSDYNQAFAEGACAWYAITNSSTLNPVCQTCAVAVSDTTVKPYRILTIEQKDCPQ